MTADENSETPVGVAEDGAGNVYLLDANTSRIEKYNVSGDLIGRYGFGNPVEVQQPNRSVGLSVDGAGNVFMLDAERSRIQKYSPSGRLIGAWGFGAPEAGTAGSGRTSADAPVLEPKEAAPAPTVSSPVGTEMTPDAGPVETMKQTVAAAPAVDMVTSTISGAASAPGSAAGRGAEVVMTASSSAASASETAAEKGAEAVESAASGVASAPGTVVGKGSEAVKSAASTVAPVTDMAGKGVEKIRAGASDVVRGRGEGGMKNPLRSEEATQAKHHWWQFWK